jgi:hypothetical protein
MPAPRLQPKRRSIAALVAFLLIAAGLTTAGLTAAPHRAYADAAGKGGDFVPINGSPVVLDTRTGIGTSPAGPRTGGTTTTFPVAGVAGVPATDVTAVLVVLLAVTPTQTTFLVAWPDGTPRPNPVSMVNAASGQTTSDTAVVGLGANGKMDVFNSGATQIVVQIQGYFTTATLTTGSGYVPVTPSRIIDTRNGTGTPKAQIAGNTNVTMTLATGAPIPTTAGSALVNITIVAPASPNGWIAVLPGGTTAGNSAVSYVGGTNASSTAVKLGAGGKITIVNHGGAAIDVIIDAEGYFGTQSTEGAGLRLLPAVRVLDQSAVAADATIDLAIGGTHGLPTRDIAGALVCLQVTSATAGGYLTAWPIGQAEPAVSHAQFPVTNARGDLVAVPTGTDGKIHIRNHSKGTVRIIVDLEGWFANPLPNLSSPPYTTVTGLQDAPVGAATVGALEFGYIDNIGRAVWGHQSDPSNRLSLQWTVLPGNEGFAGPAALARQPNGALALAAQHIDTNIWSASLPAGGTTWGSWLNNGGSMASAPVVGTQTNGSLVEFAVDGDGELWDLPQAGANGAFSAWHPLGAADLAGPLTAVTVQTGIQVFGLDGSGTLKTALLATSGTLSAWTSLGGTGLTGRPAVVLYPGFLLRVFVRGADGVIVTKMQTPSGVWPADFSPVGSMAVAGSPAALLSPASGRAEVVARTSDGDIVSTGETAQGSGTWRDWVDVLQGGDTAASDPTVLAFSPGSGADWELMFRPPGIDVRFYTVSQPSGLAAKTAAPAFGRLVTPEPPR